MYPELFRIGDFPIHTYGVLLAIAMLLALFSASRLSRRDGVASDRIYDLGLWTILGGLAGSKLLLFLTEPDAPLLSLDFMRSGGVYFGGFAGGFLALLFAVHFYKLPFLKVADAFAPALALGQAVGRLGCFASGDSWGKPTNLPWGVHFTELAHANTGVPIYAADGSSLYLHPTQLYESFAMFLVFGLLVWLHRRKRFDGYVLIAYAIVYPLVRFTIEFWRGDPRGDLLGLTTLTGLSTSQMISLLVASGAIIFLIIRSRKSGMKLLPTAPLLLLSAMLFAITASAQKEKPIRVETELVNINVSVTDKRGNAAKGLKQEQFEIFDNGVRQPIAHFSDQGSAISFGIVLDLRSLTRERTNEILGALRRFTKELPANDDFFVLAFNERGNFVFDFVPTEEQIRTQLSERRNEPASLYDVVCLAADKVRERKSQKPLLLIISDGADGNSRHDFTEMQKHLRAFDTLIYAVVFDKTRSENLTMFDLVRERKLRVNISKDATPTDRAALEELTRISGGIYHASALKNSLEIYEILRHGGDDARQQYIIGFYPATVDGKWHKIKINILPEKGVRVFASYRRGYQSPTGRSSIN